VNTIDNLLSHRFPGKRLLIKLDVEGNEYEVLKGATRLLDREPAPTWLVEHGFKENFAGNVNPRFRAVFDLFWDLGYTAMTADADRRPVLKSDVERWLESGSRDFGYLNYLFCRPDPRPISDEP
jgi:hypothetical protein